MKVTVGVAVSNGRLLPGSRLGHLWAVCIEILIYFSPTAAIENGISLCFLPWTKGGGNKEKIPITSPRTLECPFIASLSHHNCCQLSVIVLRCLIWSAVTVTDGSLSCDMQILPSFLTIVLLKNVLKTFLYCMLFSDIFVVSFDNNNSKS